MSSRPSRIILESGIGAWDADIDALFALIFDAPFPIFKVDLAGDLPTASDYESCFALVGDTLYASDGASWSVYIAEMGVSANVPDSTAVTVADMVSDFNDLLSALQTAGIMEGP